MARNGSGLLPGNVFRLATTTVEACAILARQLSIYEGFVATIGHPEIAEQLRENDLKQARVVIDAIAEQLKAWVELPNG